MLRVTVEIIPDGDETAKRTLSVGDIIKIDDDVWVCENVGWKKLNEK